MIFGTNTSSDISKLLYVISRAVRRVKFETILKCHEWYLCQKSRANHAIICLYYYPQKVVIFTCRYFRLSWNTTALSQSNIRNLSCSSITKINTYFSKITNCQMCNITTSHLLLIDMTLCRASDARKLEKRQERALPAVYCMKSATSEELLLTLGWFAYFAESSTTRSNNSYI